MENNNPKILEAKKDSFDIIIGIIVVVLLGIIAWFTIDIYAETSGKKEHLYNFSMDCESTTGYNYNSGILTKEINLEEARKRAIQYYNQKDKCIINNIDRL